MTVSFLSLSVAACNDLAEWKHGCRMTISEKLVERIEKASKNGASFDTKIIAGFPGIGKSECARRNPNFLDSDSSLFSWRYDECGLPLLDENGSKIRHPDFPANYIAHLKQVIGKVPVVFVSSHAEVRNALNDAGLVFNLVYPAFDLKHDYVQRYIERGNVPAFVQMISDNWDAFVSDLNNQANCNKLVLQKGQFLADVIDHAVGIKSTIEQENPVHGSHTVR
jgi:hypothetical protein